MSFEHLDDPAGFVPDEQFRISARRDGRRRQARRRLGIGVTSIVSTVAILTAGIGAYGAWSASRIDRVDVELAAGPVSLAEPFNVLLIGSDRREEPEEVAGARSDTMIVVRVVPEDRVVRLLSLPRDLVLGAGGEGPRLNEVFAAGGPDRLVRAVEDELGLPLSAYVEVGFEGLVDLVDEIGGVELSVAEEVRDRHTGLALAPSACTTLDGETTLQLLRSRFLESPGPDGRWVVDPSGELGRQARQRAVLAALLPKLGQLADSLGGMATSFDVATEHLTLDARFDLTAFLQLGRWFADGSPPMPQSDVLSVSVKVTERRGAVLVLAPGADDVIAQMGGQLPVSTSVANSTLMGDPAPAADALVAVQPVGSCS